MKKRRFKLKRVINQPSNEPNQMVMDIVSDVLHQFPIMKIDLIVQNTLRVGTDLKMMIMKKNIVICLVVGGVVVGWVLKSVCSGSSASKTKED